MAAPASADRLFGDRFEVEFRAPELTGELRLSDRPYVSPVPRGTTIMSLAQALGAGGATRYLQGDTSYIGQIDPFPETYLSRVDFQRMFYSYGGLVEARVTAVDLRLGDPASSTSGCEVSDFNGFPAGDIALLQRGGCAFADKARNAGQAGAVAVVIFNQGTPGREGLYTGALLPNYDRLEPVVSVSFQQGQEWASLAARRALVLAINVEQGTKASAWEFKPIAFNSADSGHFWISNVDSNKVLYSGGQTTVDGQRVHEVLLGDLDPNDLSGAWYLSEDSSTGNTVIRNYETNEHLVVLVRGADVLLVTAPSFNLNNTLCSNDSLCDEWELAETILPPPSGAARLRNALGGFYLQINDSALEAERIKSGWEQALWTFEIVPGTPYRRLRNVVTNDYLHVEYGGLAAGEVDPGWFSAMWVLEPTGRIAEMNTPSGDGAVPRTNPLTSAQGYYLIRNGFTNQVLARRGGTVQVVSGPTDTLDAIWVIDDHNVPIADSNLRAVINGVMNQAPTAQIRSAEAAGLYSLFGGASGISDLSGLEYFYNLRDLRLANNPFTDVTPIASLVNLEKLNLVQSAVEDMEPLLQNEGLGFGDVVLITRSPLRWDDRETGRIFRERNIDSVPIPGEIALHVVGTREVVEASSLELVDYADADETASWSLEYDPSVQDFYLTAYMSGFKQYFFWDDRSAEAFDDTIPANGAGRFHVFKDTLAATDQYQIVHVQSGESLKECYGDLRVVRLDPGCRELTFYISDEYFSDAISTAEANYYDPDFAPLSDNYTRIQNTKSRQFLMAASGSSVAMAEVSEFQNNSHWELVPIEMESNYLFIIRNKTHPDRYLYHTQAGTLALAALPAGAPTGVDWLQQAENQPFVFDLLGNTLGTFNVEPMVAPDRLLRDNNGALTFGDQFSSRAFWRFDGGVAVADVENKVVVLQSPTDQLFNTWPATFYISWYQPVSQYSTQMEFISYVGEGIYEIPVTARDIRITVECTNCAAIWAGETERTETVAVFERKFPKDECFEPRGIGDGRRVSICDPAEGRLAVLAEDLVQEHACPIEVLTNYVLESTPQFRQGKVGRLLIDGDTEAAKREMVNMGRLSGLPDFSNCDFPFRSMSVGVGGQAGFGADEQTGELGLIYNLLPEAEGARILSYSSLAEEINPQARLLTLEEQYIFGYWIGETEDFAGRAVGLSLNANQMESFETRVAFAASKITKKIGVSANVTLWLACDTGAGDLIYSDRCDVREDSEFLGATLEFSAGLDLSLPKMRGIGLSYSETCVPAGNNRMGDCPR